MRNNISVPSFFRTQPVLDGKVQHGCRVFRGVSRFACAAVLLVLLGGCDFVYDLFGMPNTKKEEGQAVAEAKAIGGACRQSGRSLEDCYVLNPEAHKADVYQGWKEMNDYMLANGLEIVPSKLSQPVEESAFHPLTIIPSAGQATEPDAAVSVNIPAESITIVPQTQGGANVPK